MICATALCLIVLHRIDGGEVWVNPAQVTSLRVVEGSLSARYGGGNCMVGLTDRKFVAVLQRCADVKRLLERCPGNQP